VGQATPNKKAKKILKGKICLPRKNTDEKNN